jgi:diguanylate cyclase (GGDEF)-like protein
MIDDVLEDPIFAGATDEIQQAGFRSLLVVPMAHGNEMFGTIMLRAARTKGFFSDCEIKFCQVVANTSANALKNAQLFQELKKQAITDGLTEMYNHRFFQEQFKLQSEKSKRSGRPLSLLMIDIDNFKWINDYYGHATGDQAIRYIANKLKSNSRAEDVVARYGGDEFVWLLAEADLDVAMKVANRFRKSVSSNPFEATGFLSVSIGVATYPTDTPSVARLIHQADRAMYLSKGEGGNRVRSVIDQGAHKLLDWGESV